jgi:hypothetical protein
MHPFGHCAPKRSHPYFRAGAVSILHLIINNRVTAIVIKEDIERLPFDDKERKSDG